MSILLDAGPSLNFLAVGQQNILIQIAQSQKLRLAAPARVDSEVIGMSRDNRFRSTAVQRTDTQGLLLVVPGPQRGEVAVWSERPP